MQIDKTLSFLDSYVHKSLEEGAEPYIPEHERSGTLTITNTGNRNQYETSTHSLRFEAYEVPKPIVPVGIPAPISYPTELVPVSVPEPSYHREVPPTLSSGPASDPVSTGLKLRLDGVQKKWGKPTYSSAASSSTSNSDSHRTTVNGATQPDSVVSKSRESPSYDSSSKRQPHVEVSEEKQKLAASLFGGASSSRSEKKQSGGGGGHGKVSRETNHTEENVRPVATVVQPPPPDLLDLGEPAGAISSSSSSVVDPFKQLEGLLDVSQDGAAATPSNGPDLMSLYSENGQSLNQNQTTILNEKVDAGSTHGSANGNNKTATLTKGPSLKDALNKDALVRQMGVNPTSQNPNLFSDLLG